jgi:hypothetical protein
MKLLSELYDEAIEKSRVVHPTTYWNVIHCDKLLSSLLGKKVSGPKSTGFISNIHFESLREDRYTSVDIDWDHGGMSCGVFLNNDCVTVYGVQ